MSERTFDLHEAVEVLAAHNDWRSGAVDVECIPTPILTEAFNVIIDGVRAQLIAAALNEQAGVAEALRPLEKALAEYDKPSGGVDELYDIKDAARAALAAVKEKDRG